ncbi:ubiquinol-cytochrome c reductase complex assembly factor 4 isoform X2 [Phyllopteryx taeniolatus]|uniref:ubiquinol-cytochrome c reductase complex assembly factor 4 isoform X2 n=1 Tax=Phyllopteryx taeniolatus TaxID=161469 RepID=UPI002AD4400E|nr:ubiquinol-cytochrome c reductase complex assembly factor 4 isoform X2 [Phyllopteryx taeniolatus]
MYATMAHVCTGLTSKTFSRAASTLFRHVCVSKRLSEAAICPLASYIRKGQSARPLSVSHRLLAKPEKPGEDAQEGVNNEPVRFSISKASHRTWKVDRSLGIQYKRPWWKVVPLSVIAVGFLVWCALREETDIDAQLEKELYQHLPGLVSNEENEKK